MPVPVRMLVAVVLVSGGLALAAAEQATTAPAGPRQMEHLGRGVVAVHQGDGKVFVSWRMLGTDSDDIAFNLYRVKGDGPPARLNPQPITQTTHFADTGVDLGQ